MSISFGSINTGLPPDIVQQIMQAERMPLQKMDASKGKINEKQGLLNELIEKVEKVRGNLATSTNARALRELKVETNEEIVDVRADKNVAQPGNYQFEVVSLARKSSALSSGFADPKESNVGVGFIQYYLPDGEKEEIYVDSENSSLESIAKLINGDAGNGLRANVINDGSGSESPWRLLMSLDETGDEKAADFPYFYFVDGEQDLYLESERKAQDAVVKLDGFEIEVPENKASELIPGLTIDLKKAKPGDEFSIKVSEDTEAVAGKFNEILDSLNGVIQFIKDQNNLDAESDTTRTLGGDIILQNLESRIRAAVFRDVETSDGPKKLSDIGVQFQRSGLLELDPKKFEAALSENYNVISEVLTGTYSREGGKTNGFIDNLTELTDAALRNPDGLLVSRRRSLQNNIDQVDRRIEQKQRMLDQKERGLKRKFANLEGTISRIQGQGAGISAMGGGGGGGQGAAITQLMG